MLITQKCNCCTHESVCNKSEHYKAVCEKIKNAVDYAEKDLVAVDVKCKHFMPYSTTIRNGGGIR